MEYTPHPDYEYLQPYISNECANILEEYGNRIYERMDHATMIEGIKYIENHEIIVDDIKLIIIEEIKKKFNLPNFEKKVKEQAEFYELKNRWEFILDKYQPN
jgi:hypothetical protein